MTWLGTIGAIRARVAAGAGVAMLPEYFVRDELRRKRFVRVFPQVVPRSDWFRLVFRTDDRRRAVFELLGRALAAEPLR
jgi:DNA-binding transcriptional LysR family regulator